MKSEEKLHPTRRFERPMSKVTMVSCRNSKVTNKVANQTKQYPEPIESYPEDRQR
jgi:hypothetical protein